jgi:response regulator RpfG family c-di-GMP phosphodiesterase
MKFHVNNTPWKDLELARVLLVHDDLPSRLALRAVLEAGGYAVDSAATAAEAFGKLDDSEYELVLSDMQMESPESGLEVLAHAHLMDYEPATAILTTHLTVNPGSGIPTLIESKGVPELLGRVAEMISHRAARLVEEGRRPDEAAALSS